MKVLSTIKTQLLYRQIQTKHKCGCDNLEPNHTRSYFCTNPRFTCISLANIETQISYVGGGLSPKKGKGLGHRSEEEQLRGLGVFGEKEGWGDGIAPDNSWKGCCSKVGLSVFSQVMSDRRRTSSCTSRG